MRALTFVCLLPLAACSSSDKGEANDKPTPGRDAASNAPKAKATVAPEDIRVSFGDCASEFARFASGPKSRPTADVLGDDKALDESIQRDKPRTEPVAIDKNDPLANARSAGILGVLKAGGPAFASLVVDTDLVDGPGDFRTTRRRESGLGIPNGIIGSPGGYGGPVGPPGPVFRIGPTTTKGDLDRNIVRRYVRRQLRKLRACHVDALKKKPTLTGKVSVAFQIGPSGGVLKSKATGLNDKAVEACFSRVVKQIKFPKPRNGGLVDASTRFTVGPAPTRSTTGGEKTTSPPKDRSYEPGRSNPLRSLKPSIRACVASSQKQSGVAVVQFSASSLGKVVEASAFGGDEKLNDCLAASVSGMRVPASDRPARSYRCPLAFGALEPGDAPGIDITSESIVYETKPMAVVDEVLRASNPSMLKLQDALHGRRRQWFSDERVVSVTGPLIVRPVGTTPAKVLLQLLSTAYLADYRPVLAVRRGGQWSFVRKDLVLPRAPTRQSSNAALSRPGYGRGRGRQPVIAVMASKDAVVIGTKAGPPISVSTDDSKPQAASLKARLAVLRNNPTFAVDDIDITAADDVSYADLVSVIEAVQSAGFSRWRLALRGDITIPLTAPSSQAGD